MTEIRFGTDGWRAIIAEDFTFANVRAVARAVVAMLREDGTAGRGLVVGYDTRFSSDRFAQAVAEVAAAEGVHVTLGTSFAPTPAVSLGVIERRAAGGVVITSSHNPAEWNGFKYKPDYGGSASPEVVARIEQGTPRWQAAPVPTVPLDEARRRGLIESADLCEAYLRALTRQVDADAIRDAGLRVALDSMYGAGQGLLRAFLGQDSATTVDELHAEHNPRFPGLHAPEPIARNLGEVQAAMRAAAEAGRPYRLGLATDGDADRLGVMDSDGTFVTQLQVFALLAYYLLELRGLRGPIVRSVTTTRMVDRLGERYGVPVHATPVGFKYLGPRMMEVHAILAGEESGGYGFAGHIPERDGLLAGLFILDLVRRTGAAPGELVRHLYSIVGPHHYDRVDVPLQAVGGRTTVESRIRDAAPARIAGLDVRSRTTEDGYLYELDGDAWLLVRFSGTEPLMRIYAEMPSPALVERALAEGRALAGVP